MRLAGDLVIVKSLPYFFNKEREGTKPYTVRLIDDHLMDAIAQHPPKRMRVEMREGRISQYFERDLSDISHMGRILGSTLIGFAWDPSVAQKK